jgi:predicted nucleic acid-binding protein
MYLIDTSAWIESFRRKAKFSIAGQFDEHRIFLCPPVYQEILQGFKAESVYFAAREALNSAQMVANPLTLDYFDEAAALYRLCRKSGITPRSSIDVLIAVCAIRHNLTVLHHDRDYEKIATVSQLKTLKL